MKHIYKITNPTGKIYIGKTKNLKYRTKKYKYADCQAQPKLYNSLKKYGWDAHVFETVYQGDCSDACLNRLETLYVRMYDSKNTGLNCTEGGEGTSGYTHSQEFKDFRRDVMKGNTIRRGSKHTQETKDLIRSKSKTERPERRKEICAWNLDGTLFGTYPSATEAAAILGVYQSAIANCLRGKSKTCSNLLFTYKPE